MEEHLLKPRYTQDDMGKESANIHTRKAFRNNIYIYITYIIYTFFVFWEIKRSCFAYKTQKQQKASLISGTLCCFCELKVNANVFLCMSAV